MKRKLAHGTGVVLALASLTVAARAEVFPLPPEGDDVIGSVAVIESVAEDTFVDIARRHGLGYTELRRANPDVDPWLPGAGTRIVLPTRFVLPDAPRRGVVLNLPEYRLYYYPPAVDGKPRTVHTYPISIGRMDWETPLGSTRVTAKAERPTWYPPASIRAEHAADGDPLPGVVPPGPDNPLGDHALRLDLPGYLIHGTNRPAGVGMRVTHGCIRMFPEDIAVLFGMLPVGTPVNIVNQPIKFGWEQGQLFVEAHEVLARVAPEASEASEASETSETEGEGEALAERAPADAETTVASAEDDALTVMTRAFVAATEAREAVADWAAMEAAVDEARGIPTAVGTPAPEPATADILTVME
ncbi:MAG: L,D-transpeptidase family protein [Pseudomonadota bacterium]